MIVTSLNLLASFDAIHTKHNVIDLFKSSFWITEAVQIGDTFSKQCTNAYTYKLLVWVKDVKQVGPVSLLPEASPQGQSRL